MSSSALRKSQKKERGPYASDLWVGITKGNNGLSVKAFLGRFSRALQILFPKFFIGLSAIFL